MGSGSKCFAAQGKTFFLSGFLFLASTAAAWLLDRGGMHFAGGIVLLVTAVLLGLIFLVRDSSLVSVPFLLSLFWIGGEGLALMRLSFLHSQWSAESWMSFSGFYLFFLAGYFAAQRWTPRPGKTGQSTPPFSRIFRLTVLSAAVPFAGFLAEAVILGYVPLFADFTHAYDHFHITGLHYITVSSVFTFSLTVICLMKKPWGELSGKEKASLVLANLLSVSIPVLCISKLQLFQTIVFAIIVYFCLRKEIPVKRLILMLASALVILAGAAVVMTFRRNYEEGYLDSIFQMRDKDIPLFLQYVYMYIANNFANFDLMTKTMASGQMQFSHGMKQLFPVFALTGLKFIRPELINYPNPVTIEELTTLTVIYDAYYDFGIVGVVLFSLVFGFVCGQVSRRVRGGDNEGNPLWALLYAQLALYVILSFFSTWFTVPTTWFYFVLTAVGFWYADGCRLPGKKR